jgi:protein-disulfide isomerase
VPLLEQVLEKYPQQVKLVFKNFPLGNHRFARPAAAAALAAGEQGKFWEYHDKLFEMHNRLNEDSFLTIAEEMGLDIPSFEAARKKPEITALINHDLQEGKMAGVRGTPTIFVNGRRLQQRSLDGFSRVIEREIERSEKK